MPDQSDIGFLWEEPPVDWNVRATVTEGGITVDFPVCSSTGGAWHFFKIGAFLLTGSAICLALGNMKDYWLSWVSTAGLLLLVCGVGAVLLAAESWRLSWLADGDHVSQLAVAGNLLIRTMRDHRKNVWYREEIRAISVEAETHTHAEDTETEIGTLYVTIHAVYLFVKLNSGEKVALFGWRVRAPATDDRPKAELEGIATQLRRALFLAGKAASSHAIQARIVYSDEDRFTQ